MATTSRPPLARYVALTEEYGQARLAATVVIETPDGAPRTITAWGGGSATGARFYGLEVTAYVDGTADLAASGIWAPRVRYHPFDIQTAAQARAIGAVPGRIERGLDRLGAAEGYLEDSDYAGYLTRVGRILSISRFLARACRQRRQHTGQAHYPAHGSGLRRWVEQVAEDVMAGNRREHLPGRRHRHPTHPRHRRGRAAHRPAHAATGCSAPAATCPAPSATSPIPTASCRAAACPTSCSRSSNWTRLTCRAATGTAHPDRAARSDGPRDTIHRRRARCRRLLHVVTPAAGVAPGATKKRGRPHDHRRGRRRLRPRRDHAHLDVYRNLPPRAAPGPGRARRAAQRAGAGGRPVAAARPRRGSVGRPAHRPPGRGHRRRRARGGDHHHRPCRPADPRRTGGPGAARVAGRIRHRPDHLRRPRPRGIAGRTAPGTAHRPVDA